MNGLGMGLFSNPRFQAPAQNPVGSLFEPTRTNAMGPVPQGLMGMDPNFPNMVGPTSALSAAQQAPQSQIPLPGMMDQIASQQQPPVPEDTGTGAPEDWIQQLISYGILQQNPLAGNPGAYPGMQGQYVSPAQYAQWLWDSEQGGG